MMKYAFKNTKKYCLSLSKIGGIGPRWFNSEQTSQEQTCKSGPLKKLFQDNLKNKCNKNTDNFRTFPLAGILLITNLQQTSFENIVTKQEIAHNEQFILLQQCFQLSFIYRDCPHFCLDYFEVVCCRFAICGKSLTG